MSRRTKFENQTPVGCISVCGRKGLWDKWVFSLE